MVETGGHLQRLKSVVCAPKPGLCPVHVCLPSSIVRLRNHKHGRGGSINFDSEGNYGGGQFFLKSHANEGIVAGQYEHSGAHVFELNVGWHHGESGGPVFRLAPLAAFALMQSYRGIQSPNGVYAGPHQGRSINAIRAALESLGVAAT